jgi:hypothetical protein
VIVRLAGMTGQEVERLPLGSAEEKANVAAYAQQVGREAAVERMLVPRRLWKVIGIRSSAD